MRWMAIGEWLVRDDQVAAIQRTTKGGATLYLMNGETLQATRQQYDDILLVLGASGDNDVAALAKEMSEPVGAAFGTISLPDL
ncbi:MAG: hypothetical protein P4L84_05465 [Isosphaeraceae bacterium]|nr:hypothetical protein [Isosphaeraceae bacterium]